MSDVPQESQLLVRSSGIPACRLVWDLIQLVRREVRCVRDRPQPRNERCLDIPDRGPIHPVEERVFLDMFHAQTAIRRSDQPKFIIIIFIVCQCRENEKGGKGWMSANDIGDSNFGGRGGLSEAVNLPNRNRIRMKS